MTTLNREAASIILENMVSSVMLTNYELRGVDGTFYGKIVPETFEKLASKKDYSILSANGEKFLVHDKNRKVIQKKLKAVEINVLPEGAVVFPEDNFVIMAVFGKKDSDKFFKKLISTISTANLKDLDVSDDSFGLKKWDDYFAAPYVDINDPSKLHWYVSPNNSKKKYAWIGLSLDQAVDKLYELHEAGNVKAKKNMDYAKAV
jgi:hypothetical protein